MRRFLSCLQHSRPCCIGYTNSRLRLEFVYPIQHGRSCCKHYIYTWLAYLFNTQFCLRYTKHRPKPTRYRRYINLYSKIWHFCGCWCYVLRWIWCLWCYSECASVTLSVHPHRASWKVYLTTVGIEPASFGIPVQRSVGRALDWYPVMRQTFQLSRCGCTLRVT
jgi:hypothetical protein